jgi:hypothetical protein
MPFISVRTNSWMRDGAETAVIAVAAAGVFSAAETFAGEEDGCGSFAAAWAKAVAGRRTREARIIRRMGRAPFE